MSEDIRVDELAEIFAPEYKCYQVFLSPSDAGHDGVARLRTYIYFAHQERVEYAWDLFDLHYFIRHEIRKVVSTRPRDYLVSDSHVRVLDSMALARKRKIPFEPAFWISSAIFGPFFEPLI